MDLRHESNLSWPFPWIQYSKVYLLERTICVLEPEQRAHRTSSLSFFLVMTKDHACTGNSEVINQFLRAGLFAEDST